MADAAMFSASKEGQRKFRQFRRLKWRAFVLTFFAYTSFHLSRKPASIVKNVLHPSSPDGQSTYNATTHPGWAPFNQDLVPQTVAQYGLVVEAGGDGALDGVYDCDTNSTTPDGVCQRWVRNGGAQAGAAITRHVQRVSNSGSNKDLACWEILDNHGRLQYYQLVVDNKDGSYTCTELPLITTPTKNLFWLVAPGGTGPAPAVRPNLTNGKILLGLLDTTFLISYAAGLFVAGHIGDNVNLRWFLALGMIGSGIFVAMLGMGYYWHVHHLWFYLLVYLVQGLFQAIGWPSVVGVVGSWFGQRTRGGAMGVWNAHTSCGNILGSLVSVAALGIGMNGNDWPMAFFIPGGIIFTMGLVVLAGLVAHPHDRGLPSPNDNPEEAAAESAETGLLASHAAAAASDGSSKEYGTATSSARTNDSDTAPLVLNRLPQQPKPDDDDDAAPPYPCASFIKALCIPGVIPFALALFFAKLVAYTFIYWLPLYLSHINYSTDEAGRLSTFFDLGGIVGGITAGFLSDMLRMRAFVAWLYLLLAIPGLYFYRVLTRDVGDSSTSLNILFMLVCGAIVNGPYALITTAVSADLGAHKSLKNDAKLLASVTGIIDGTGSIGAALQGVLISVISSRYSWNAVFYALIACSFSSAVLLSWLVFKEVRDRCRGVNPDDDLADEDDARIERLTSPGPMTFRRKHQR